MDVQLEALQTECKRLRVLLEQALGGKPAIQEKDMQDGLSNDDKIKVEMAFQAKEVQLNEKEEEVNLLKGKVQQLQQIVIEKNLQNSAL